MIFDPIRKKVEECLFFYIVDYWKSVLGCEESCHRPEYFFQIWTQLINKQTAVTSPPMWVSLQLEQFALFISTVLCLFSFTLHVFIMTTVSCHFIMSTQIWNLNELLNAATSADPSFVVPGDPEVIIFVLMTWHFHSKSMGKKSFISLILVGDNRYV